MDELRADLERWVRRRGLEPDATGELVRIVEVWVSPILDHFHQEIEGLRRLLNETQDQAIRDHETLSHRLAEIENRIRA